MRLFVQSARRVQPRFEMRQEYGAPVARICALVRGMPLGIELAAGWAEMLTPQEIADEVARCIDFLESSNNNIPERQRSVRAIFDSSWRLLNDDERAAFVRMAVFRGSFTRAAGQAVTGAGLRPLMGLVNKSFLQRDPDTGRYIAHELMRQFAEEMLDASGEADAVMHAHSEFYLREVADLLPAIQSPRQPEAFSSIDWGFENVRAAIMYAAKHGRFDAFIEAAHPLGIYFDLRALYTEGLGVFKAAADVLRGHPSTPSRDNALAVATYWAAFYATYFRQNEIAQPLITEALATIRPDAPVQVWAQLHMASGYYHLLLGDVMLARAELDTAAKLFRECGRVWDAAHALMNSGTAYWYRNPAETTDFETSRRLCIEALRLCQSINEGHLAAYCYLSIGRVDGLQHAYETAAENLGKALRLFREARNVFAVGMCLAQLSVNCVIRGQIDDARPLIREDLVIQRQRGNLFGVAQALLVEARLELWAGNWEESRTAAAEALLIAEDIGNLEFAHSARVAIARVDIVALEYDDGRRMLEHALSVAQQHDRRAEMCGALHELSLAYFCLDRFEDARLAAQDMLELAESIGSRSHVAVAHFSIGRMAFFTKDLVTARGHFDAALEFLLDDTAQQSVNGWDDGYRYQTLYSVLADAAELELEEGNPDGARILLRDAINTAFKWNNIPGLFDGLTFGFQLLAAIGDLETAAEIAVFVREQPRAYAYTRSLASGFLRKLHQDGSLPNFHAIVNRPSALQLETVVRLLLSRL
jgi:tetratricopeptide (TPR) repeat protein